MKKVSNKSILMLHVINIFYRAKNLYFIFVPMTASGSLLIKHLFETGFLHNMRRIKFSFIFYRIHLQFYT